MRNQPETENEEFTNDGEPIAVDLVLSSDGPAFDLPDDADPLEGGVDEYPLGEGLDDDEPVMELPQPKKRSRSAPIEVRALAEGEQVSVYQRLVDYGLLKKLTDIVLAKVSVPWHLREDAAQEVHAAWAGLQAKSNFARNQLARYAYMSGQHAALKLRRNIGAVVAIPGALFRTGRDSSFMEAIGAAVNPKDVDDYRDSLDLSVEPQEYSMPPQQVSPEFFKTRLGSLQLSKSQRAVAERVLVRRMSAESIATELGVRVTYVERLISQVAVLLNEKDDEDFSRKYGGQAPKPAVRTRARKTGSETVAQGV